MIDVARVCGVYAAKFYRDDDRVQNIRYYRVPNGTPALPVPTLFGHPNWIMNNDEFEPDEGTAGVFQGQVSYSKGQRPALWSPDGHYCGPDTVFVNGGLSNVHASLVWTEFEFSTCCLFGHPVRTSYTMRGGIESGGKSRPQSPYRYHASGGVASGEQSYPRLDYSYEARGGISQGGTTAPLPPPVPPPVAAHVEIGGDGSKPFRFIVTMSDGIEWGGAGEFPPRFTYEADGGCEVGGTYLPYRYVVEADGGDEVGGLGDGPHRFRYHADGGSEVGGKSSVPRFSYRMRGGLEVGPGRSEAGVVRIPTCEHGMPRRLRTRFTSSDIGFFGMFCPGDLFTFGRMVPHHGFIEYSDIEEAWIGTSLFGRCGGVVSTRLEYVGPTFDDWHLVLTFGTGNVIDTPITFGSAQCVGHILECYPLTISSADFNHPGDPIALSVNWSSYYYE